METPAALNTHVKFTDEEVDRFFNEANAALGRMRFDVKLRPARLSNFRDKQMILDRTAGRPFNAYCVASLGSNYDGYGTSDSEAVDFDAKASETAAKLVSTLNAFCRRSKDPLFAKLSAECVNRDVYSIRTREVENDDGLEEYGVELFLKIHM